MVHGALLLCNLLEEYLLPSFTLCFSSGYPVHAILSGPSTADILTPKKRNFHCALFASLPEMLMF